MRALTFLALTSLLLTACGGGTATSPTNPLSPTAAISTPTSPACTTIGAQPTPGADAPSHFPPEGPDDHARGADVPSLTITEYSDYQDLRSGALALALKQLLDVNPDNVRVVSRIFPLLDTHDKAALAAQAAEAAGNQGKFWEMHDLLYEEQVNWVTLTPGDFEQWITAQASALEMDLERFQSDLNNQEIAASIQDAWETGQKNGLPGTPIVLLNGQIYVGPRDFSSLNDILQLMLHAERQFSSCPPVVVREDAQYIATLQTEKGEIVLQLFADKAPVTVNSFVFLAQQGWYDDITFHRVIPDLFAQTGDPSGTGKGNPGYYVITEFDRTLSFDKPGMVAMVNSGPDSSGSQFFITYAAAPQYSGQYTIFGQVLRGMEVLESLTPRDAQPGTVTAPGDRLLSVTIDEK